MNKVERINVNFKKLHDDAQIPSQNNVTDSGYDLVAVDDGVWDKDGRYIEYSTGIAIEMPFGYHAKLSPRGSNSKYDLLLCNSEGLVDNAYRGDLKLRYKYTPPVIMDKESVKDGFDMKIYKKGDKIAQVYFEKVVYAQFNEVEDLSDSERGHGAFGSTELKVNK